MEKETKEATGIPLQNRDHLKQIGTIVMATAIFCLPLMFIIISLVGVLLAFLATGRLYWFAWIYPAVGAAFLAVLGALAVALVRCRKKGNRNKRAVALMSSFLIVGVLAVPILGALAPVNLFFTVFGSVDLAEREEWSGRQVEVAFDGENYYCDGEIESFSGDDVKYVMGQEGKQILVDGENRSDDFSLYASTTAGNPDYYLWLGDAGYLKLKKTL